MSGDSDIQWLAHSALYDSSEKGDTDKRQSLEFIKRQLDLWVAFASLLLMAPLLVLISMVIVIGHGRPVIIAHMRVGRGGVTFPCLKFRSMVLDGEDRLRRYFESSPEARQEWETTRKLKSDPRVTCFGRVLRKSSLDELPQLVNVLRGEMSLVGPRPIVKEEMQLYGVYSQDYLSVRPGMTGPWQVSGRNDMSYDTRIRMDAQYARTWSLAGDFTILLKTVWVVLRTRGSY